MELASSDFARQRMAEVVEAGIQLDKYGMVKPSLEEENLDKVTQDLLETRARIAEVLGEGKHIIYLPGSFDLVHVGHASYVRQCIDNYLSRNLRLTRDKIFVILLADDDEMIRAMKPSYLFNNPGDHPRPMENRELFEHVTDEHPRLVDLASLDSDLVGSIPAPTQVGDLLRSWLF